MCEKYDSLECPKCGARLCLIAPGNAYCDACGYDVYGGTGFGDEEWQNLPWDTFRPAGPNLSDDCPMPYEGCEAVLGVGGDCPITSEP